MHPHRDMPEGQGSDYNERIMQPLAMGLGIAAFEGFDADGDDTIITAFYKLERYDALNPDAEVRVKAAITAQEGARIIAAGTHGVIPHFSVEVPDA